MAVIVNKQRSNEPTQHVPDDLLIEILLRLSGRSLFMFMFVCKNWLRLIQNPTFITLHSNRPFDIRSNQEPIIIMRSIEDQTNVPVAKKLVFTLLSDDETLAYNDDVALDIVSPSMGSRLSLGISKFHLLGPCNGVFCITDGVDVALTNPVTRESRQLPPCYSSPRDRDVLGYFGCVSFGFDTVCNDYKVVMFNYDDDDEDEDDEDVVIVDVGDGGDYHNFKVDIYCLSTNCWRVSSVVVPSGYIYKIRSHSLFFNGALHWLGGDDDDEIDYILVFDLNKEGFRLFELPDSFDEDDDVVCVSLSNLNESLALVVEHDIYYSELNVMFKIWVMTKYGPDDSWSKLYNINNDVGIVWQLSFSKKNELLGQNKEGGLVSFNLKTSEIKKFQVHGVPRSMHAFRYKESLVSLK